MSTGKSERKIVPSSSAVVRELDPSIQNLERADSYWFLALVLAVLVAGVAGLYLWSNSTRSVPSGAEPGKPAPAETTSSSRPEISPLERARAWQEDRLAGTEFAVLPVHQTEEGCFLVYTVRRGDTLSGVLARYRPHAPEAAATWREVCDAAQAHHDLQYAHGLWPGDEIWLLLPQAGLTSPAPLPADQTPPTEGASPTSLRGI